MSQHDPETTFLSREFVAGIIVQTIIFLVLGGIAWGNIKAEVAEIQKDQSVQTPNPERIARIEEQLKAISTRQVEFKSDIKEITAAVYELKAEIKRERDSR